MPAIRLTFKGQEYLIPADRAFRAGAQVEDVVSLAEIASWGARPRFFKIAEAYGTLLRFAGAEVTDEDVHAEMMAGLSRSAASGVAEEIPAALAINALMACLMGGAPMPEAEGDTPGKPTAS